MNNIYNILMTGKDAAFYAFEIFTEVHWLLISAYVFFGLCGLFFYRSRIGVELLADDKYEIVVVSIANNGVKKALNNNLKKHTNMFKRINLVIDEGAELEQELKQRTDINLIIVPRKFKCKAIAKGRAIEYYNRFHVEFNKWYIFADDDNLIEDTRFLFEIPKYEKLGYGLANPILVPRQGESKICFVADALRYFDDLTLFRATLGWLKKPLNGVHGELLITKGSHLRTIGFNRETLTEDYAYARECHKRGIKTWQSSTRVSILSPHTITEFIKQRNRWYKGISKDFREASWDMKIFSGIRVMLWKVGIFTSWAAAPVWFFTNIPLTVKILCSSGALYYLSAYMFGLWKLKAPLYQKLGLFLIMPVYSILENIAPWMYKNVKKFVVIRK